MNTPVSIAAQIPVGRVMAWCSPWLALIAFLLLISQVGHVEITYKSYRFWRNLGIVILIAVAVVGILRALDIVGDSQDPWYTIPFLVSLVLFWGLFPATWFFLEYLLFDLGVFQLPSCPNTATSSQGAEVPCVAPTKAAFLASLKIYADMAAKIWAAVAVALGVVIGLAKRA
jgi:hypothetical protein